MNYVHVCYAVPDTAAALAVGPIKPILGQARSDSGLVCIAFYMYELLVKSMKVSSA